METTIWGFRVPGLGSRISDVGLRVWGLEFSADTVPAAMIRFHAWLHANSAMARLNSVRSILVNNLISSSFVVSEIAFFHFYKAGEGPWKLLKAPGPGRPGRPLKTPQNYHGFYRSRSCAEAGLGNDLSPYRAGGLRRCPPTVGRRPRP